MSVQFPKPTSDLASSSDFITIKANESLIPEIQAGIDRIISDYLSTGPATVAQFNLTALNANGIEDFLTIPNADVGRIVGRGGDGLTEVMRKYSVGVWVIDDGSNPEGTVRLRLLGSTQDSIEKAKQFLAVSITITSDCMQGKIRISHSVQLPSFITEKLLQGSSDGTEVLVLREIGRKARQEYSVNLEVTAEIVRSGVLSILGTKKQVQQASAFITKRIQELACF